MLDAKFDALIHLNDVPNQLPLSPRTGRPLHVETVRRWVTRGVRGVRLEVIRLPGGTFTSTAAIAHFIDEFNAVSAGGVDVAHEKSRRSLTNKADGEVRGEIMLSNTTRVVHNNGTTPIDRFIAAGRLARAARERAQPECRGLTKGPTRLQLELLFLLGHNAGFAGCMSPGGARRRLRYELEEIGTTALIEQLTQRATA